MLPRSIRRRPAHRFIKAPVTREILQNAARCRSQRNHRRQRRRAARHRALRIRHHHIIARRIPHGHRRDRVSRPRRPANWHRPFPPLIRQRRTTSHHRKSRRPANRLRLRTRSSPDHRWRRDFFRNRHRRNRRILIRPRHAAAIKPNIHTVCIRHRADAQHPVIRAPRRHKPIVLHQRTIHEHIHAATDARGIQRHDIDDVSLPRSRPELHRKEPRTAVQTALADSIPRRLLRRTRPRKTADRIRQRSRRKNQPVQRIIHPGIPRHRHPQQRNRRSIRRAVPEIPPLARRIAIAQKIRRKPPNRRIRKHLRRARHR